MPDRIIFDVDQVGLNATGTSTGEHFRVNADRPCASVPGSVVVAIDSGHPDAAPRGMYSLGILLATMQVPPDLAGARRWYEQATNAGHTSAMVGLSPILAIEGDTDSARILLQQASHAGNCRADDYATVLDDNPAGRKRARVTLRKLAEQGDTGALNFLGSLRGATEPTMRPAPHGGNPATPRTSRRPYCSDS